MRLADLPRLAEVENMYCIKYFCLRKYAGYSLASTKFCQIICLGD